MDNPAQKSPSLAGSTGSHTSSTSKHPPAKRDIIDSPFSLTPSIYLPYPSLPSTATTQPLEPEQKLTTILQNLDHQQEAVRKNMLALVLQRAEQLRSSAAARLEGLKRTEGRGEGGEGVGERAEGSMERAMDEKKERREKERKEEGKRALKDLSRRIHAPSKPIHASKPHEYELARNESFASVLQKQVSTSIPTSTEDVIMTDPRTGENGNGNEVEGEGETEQDILRGLSRDLRELVDHAVEEMGGYAEHARGVKEGYERALEKRVGRGAGGTNGGGGGGGGILKNANHVSPVDREALRRMSGGGM